MGRWKEVRSPITLSAEDYNELVAKPHNADCDAYEARIAELEAQKAHWKKVSKYEFGQVRIKQISASRLLAEIARLHIELEKKDGS